MIKFFCPKPTAKNRGRLMAQSFTGAIPAEHGEPLGDVNMHYGILHGGSDLYQQCNLSKKTWVHSDYGFIGERPDIDSDNGFFRFSRNSQAPWLGMCRPDYDRLILLQDLGHIALKDPNHCGGFKTALYLSPSGHMRAFYNLPDNFDEYWQAVAKTYCSKLVINPEVKATDLDQFDLVMSFNSALGYKALERGIQAIMTAPQSLWPWGVIRNSARFIAARYYTFALAASCHWNFAEMRSGKALEAMKRTGVINDQG